MLEPGANDLEGLFGAAGEGLFVTDVAGLHSGVNPVSGTFSVGASGRLIEGGEAGAPVRELTAQRHLPLQLVALSLAGNARATANFRRCSGISMTQAS